MIKIPIITHDIIRNILNRIDKGERVYGQFIDDKLKRAIRPIPEYTFVRVYSTIIKAVELSFIYEKSGLSMNSSNDFTVRSLIIDLIDKNRLLKQEEAHFLNDLYKMLWYHVEKRSDLATIYGTPAGGHIQVPCHGN